MASLTGFANFGIVKIHARPFSPSFLQDNHRDDRQPPLRVLCRRVRHRLPDKDRPPLVRGCGAARDVQHH